MLVLPLPSTTMALQNIPVAKNPLLVPPNVFNPSKAPSKLDSSEHKIYWNSEIHKLLWKQEHTEVAVDSIRLEVVPGMELSDEDLMAIVQNYREDFGYKLGNAWGEYKQCGCTDCKSVFSIQDAYNLKDGEYFPLSFLEKYFTPNVTCSTHPEQDSIQDMWNKDALFYAFHKKYRLQKETLASLLRSPDGSIVGYNIAYPTTYDQAWKMEFEAMYPNFKELYRDKLSEKVGYTLTDESPVFAWNLIGITKPYRKPELTKQLLASVKNHLDERYDNYPVLLELDKFNPYSSIIMAVGGSMLCDHPTYNRLGLAIGSSFPIKEGISKMIEFYEGNAEMKEKVMGARKQLLQMA